MPRRRSDRQAIRGKLGGSGSGSMDYRPPASGRGLVKNSEDPKGADSLDEALLRQLVVEIIRACDDGKWCLFTKSKDKRTHRRRRLGTHSSRAGAERQERAIKAGGG